MNDCGTLCIFFLFYVKLRVLRKQNRHFFSIELSQTIEIHKHDSIFKLENPAKLKNNPLMWTMEEHSNE